MDGKGKQSHPSEGCQFLRRSHAMRVLCLLTLGPFLITGCRHYGSQFNARRAPAALAVQPVAVTNRVSPDLLKPQTNLFTLGPGDKLEIELLSDPTSKTITTVGPDGKIYFNLL